MVGPGVNNYNWGLQDKKGLPKIVVKELQGTKITTVTIWRQNCDTQNEKNEAKKVYQNSEAGSQRGVGKFIKTVRPGDRKMWSSLTKQ